MASVVLFEPHGNALVILRRAAQIARPKLASSHDFFIFHSIRTFSLITS